MASGADTHTHAYIRTEVISRNQGPGLKSPMLLYDSVHSSNHPVFSIIVVIVKVALNHSAHAIHHY